MSSRPASLGQLRDSGWESVPVKEEVRRNAAAAIRAGTPLVDGVIGYEDTVLPQLENALLAGHDIIFLGERGQAKTRMIRSMTGFHHECLPIVAGSEILDDPYHPISRHARDVVGEKGDDTPIDWVHRHDRFGEKLATPDTSIADLIGEVDPIKVAEGRYLSDELTLHYGMVPRTNRGIFAINELPDLAERIQVGLLNVLEERDVQIRGYKIRLPLDVMLVASANPEDYTNRGRIITPHKDRFGAQIRTHYPLDVERKPHREAADLDVALLEDVQEPNLDALGEVGELVQREDPPVGSRHEPVVKGQLVREVPAFCNPDRVDLADQVGDRGVGGGQLLREALAAVHPADRSVRALRGDEVDPVTRDRRERVVANFGAGNHGQPLVEQIHEGPRDPGLRLAPLAEQDHVVACQKGVLELRQDRLVEAEDPLYQRRASGHPSRRVSPQLLANWD